MKLSSILEVTERLAKLSVDHPEMSDRINGIILDLLANEPTPLNRVVRILDEPIATKPGPRPGLSANTERARFEPDPPREQVYYTVHEAATMLGYDHQRVAKWCKDGLVRADKAWRAGKRRCLSWRIEAGEIERIKALLAANKAG